MGNDTKFRTKSNIHEASEEGLLFGPAWTQTWGLKVYPWYEMDKVKFSFIEKGKEGKGRSFDVCVTTRRDAFFDFECFCHEVLHDIRTPYDFWTIMAQEKAAGEQYPKRYKFITGENGEKSVGICNSKNGSFCINGKCGDRYANIPVSYYDIYRLCEAFVSTYKKRKTELYKIREAAFVRIASYHKKDEIPDADYVPEVDAVEPLPPAEDKIPLCSTPVKIHVVTTSKIQVDDAGGYSFDATTDDEKLIKILIPQSVVSSDQNLFDRFRSRVNSKSTQFSFSGGEMKRSDGTVYYVMEQFC